MQRPDTVTNIKGTPMPSNDDTRFYIEGAWLDRPDAPRIAVRNPYSEDVIGHIAAGSATDVDLAVAAARPLALLVTLIVEAGAESGGAGKGRGGGEAGRGGTGGGAAGRPVRPRRA